jgi:hypothetical protein
MKKFTRPNFLFISSIFSLFLSISVFSQTPSVLVTSSNGNNPICSGDQVIFTASIINPPILYCTGSYKFTSFTYLWYINNINVSSGNQLVSSNLKNGDLVKCNVIYGWICSNAYPSEGTNIYNSNSIAISVKPNHPDLRITNASTQLINNIEYNFSVATTSVPDLIYEWDIPANIGTIQSGQNTPSIWMKTTGQEGVSGEIRVLSYSMGCSASSGISAIPIVVNVFNTAPTYPSNLRVASVNSNTSLTLAWDESTDNTEIVQYHILYKDINAAGPYNVITSPTPSIVINGLVEGVKYKFLIEAEDSDGKFSNNTKVLNTMNPNGSAQLTDYIDMTPPSIPTDLLQVQVTGSTVALVWNQALDNVGTTKYEIYQNDVLVKADNVGVTYIAHFTSTPNTFKIRAKDAKGNISGFSESLLVNKVDPFIIDPITGNVGVGVQPPSEKLDIDGNIKIRGNIISNPVTITGSASTPNRIHFEGSSLDFYTPVQAQWNGDKPLMSMSQYGEINFNSSPILNYNAINFKGGGDYNNGMRYGEDFGGINGFKGPIIYGENGGALGSSVNNQNWEPAGTKAALRWDNLNRVTISGTTIMQGGIDEKLNMFGFSDASGQYTGPTLNMNYNGKITSGGRMVLQEHMTDGDANALSKWGRMLLSNNLEWDAQQKKYHVLERGGNADLQMMRYENHGGIAFYTRNQLSSGVTPNETLPEYIDQTTLDQKYRRMSITGHGTVVIGNQPTDVLEVINSQNQDEKLRVFGQTSFDGKSIFKSQVSASHVGIWEPIEVQGNGAGISFHDRIGGGAERWVIYSQRTGGVNTNTLRFFTGDADRMSIAPNGNVGIGTTAPTSKLEVIGSEGNGVAYISTNGRYKSSGNDGGMYIGASNQMFVGGDGVDQIGFYNGNDWRLLVSSSGNVGIGTTATPTAKLEVIGTAKASELYATNVNNSGGIKFGARTNYQDENAARITINNSNSTNESLVIYGAGSNWDKRKVTIQAEAGFVVNGKTIFNGIVEASDIRVCANPGTCPEPPDYVFEKNYKLLSLKEIEDYISKYSHLPDVPSASEMKEKGVSVAQMNMILLRKVEELTLHIIELEKKIQKK